MISVLCPTRMRPGALKRSLDSLLETANGPLEFQLAVDNDDPTDYSQFGAYSPYKGRVLHVERFGYAQLHDYYNLLAERATGDWLLLWNDDALMATPGWDDIVRSHEPKCVLSPHTVHDPLCTFPIVPRRFVETIGHFSLNAHCDSWWQMIAERLGILVWPDIRVDHRRADVTGENNDSVYSERVYQTAEFESEEMREARGVDALKLLTVL